jgi:hypothetical protein
MSEQQISDNSPHEPLPDFVRRRQLPVVTLDHNSILGYFKIEDGDLDATEKNKDDAQALTKLFSLQRAWVIRLLVPAVTMLENQPAGKEIDIQEWARRLAPLGFDSQDIFAGMLPISVSTPEAPEAQTFGAEHDLSIYYRVHNILNRSSSPQAKNIDADWRTYRDRMCMEKWAQNGLGDVDQTIFAELLISASGTKVVIDWSAWEHHRRPTGAKSGGSAAEARLGLEAERMAAEANGRCAGGQRGSGQSMAQASAGRRRSRGAPPSSPAGDDPAPLGGAAGAAADAVGARSARLWGLRRRVDGGARGGGDRADLWSPLSPRFCQSEPARLWVEPPAAPHAGHAARRGQDHGLDPRAVAGAQNRADDEGATIVWGDESGFSLLPRAVRTWAPRGQTPILRVPLTRDHLAAISALNQRPHAGGTPLPPDASSSRCAKTATMGRRSSGTCVCWCARWRGRSCSSGMGRRSIRARPSRTSCVPGRPSACSWSSCPATRLI